MIAILTDTHFGARADNLAFHNYFRRFYTDVFFPYLDKHNITHVIHPGDVFDRRKHINFNSLHLARDYFFDPLEARGIKMDVVLGNHDVHYKDTLNVNSPFLLLGEYKNIEVHRDPHERDEFLFLPWVCAENRGISDHIVRTTDKPIMIAHMDINGFDLGGGRLCDHGFAADEFARFKLVLTGHYHKKQTLGNIHYLGAPYEMTWVDYNQPKGFHMLDPETLNLEYIRNPYRIFHKLHYDDKDKSHEVVLGRDFTQYEGCYLKVILINKINPYLFDLFMEALYKNNPAHVSVVEDHHNLNTLNDETLIDQTEDTLTIIGKYVKNVDVQVDKADLVFLLSELYNEAISMDIE